MVDTKNHLNQIQYKISNCTCALFFGFDRMLGYPYFLKLLII